MSFGRGYFDDDDHNRRGFGGRNFGNFDNDPSFGNFSNSAFDNIRRQRSPIFNNERDHHFDSQMTSNNFPSFSNRNPNFGYHPQQHPPQQQQAPQNDPSSKVYHVPIHIEKGNDNQSNSYIKLSEQPGHQQQQNIASDQQQQQHPSSNQPSSFHHPKADANYQTPSSNLSNFRERAAQEFKRQQEELKSRAANQQQQQFNDAKFQAPQQSQQQQGGEYRIPIRIEGDLNEPNNLVRDFNKMHCPSAVRTSKPGQKHSSKANPSDFINSQDFNNTQSSYGQPPNANNSTQFTPQQQQSNQQQQPQRPAQQPKKTDPMSIIQDTLEEVENYEHEVDNFKGEFQDKQYRYLDEYLTRCMLKLDNIDVNGDANLKQSRKNAVNYINRVISKLEKVENKKQESVGVEETEKGTEEKMEDKQAEIVEDESKEADDAQPQIEEETSEKPDANDEVKSSEDKKSESNKQEKKNEKKKTTKKSDGKEKKKIKKEENDDKKD